jgi:LysM repeat protein
MAGRNPVRFLAPIALLAFAFALYHVVQDARGPKETPASTQSASPTATAKSGSGSKTSDKGNAKTKAKTYTVKRGDTPSGIAEKAGLTLTKLNALNPKLSSKNLTPGQKIRLAK